MGRLKIAFPYLLFGAMGLGVVGASMRADVEPPPSAQPVQSQADICPPCGMRVAAGKGVTAEVRGRSQRFCSEGCKKNYLETAGKEHRGAARSADAGEGRWIDPVCKMEVNPAWGIHSAYRGTTFYFCTDRCRRTFSANPAAYVRLRCLVCLEPITKQRALPATYMGRTYWLCSEAHRAEFKADPAGFFMHRMWGIPDWLYYVSIALVLLVSFLMFEGIPGSSRAVAAGAGLAAAGVASGGLRLAWREDRIDLMQLRLVRRLLLSRPVRFACQLAMVSLFGLIIAAGLFGNQNPALNIAPLLTWTIWWCGLVILILFAGKVWCYMCPWDAIATWMERLRLWRKTETGAGLALRWPRAGRNIALATILFVALTWVELGFGVTMRPRATAYIAIAMLAMAIVSAFLFERKSFCRYGCLVGRVSGLYAMFAGIEVRARGRDVCKSCRSKECVRGSERAYGCPTFEYPGRMQTNTYCIQCTECLQACPHDNLAVNLRPWGADLAIEGRPRRDEAYLALLMLAITGFHGLTMTPAWQSLLEKLRATLPLGHVAAFSLAMTGLMALPVVIYAGLVGVSYAMTTASDPAGAGSSGRVDRRISYGDYFVRYAYCLLPIALFYHLAHNLEHLLMEGQKVVALLSDPFGWGWNLFGTAALKIPPLVSLDVLWILQVVLVATGHVYSLWAAQKISRRLFADRKAASRGQWPMLAGMIAFSVLSLWLLKQPMEMRTSAM